MSVVDNTVVGQGGAVGHLTSGSQLSLRARLAEVCRTVKQQQDTQNRNHQSRRRRRRESIVWRSSARATTTTTTTVGHSSAESRRLGGGSAAARRAGRRRLESASPRLPVASSFDWSRRSGRFDLSTSCSTGNRSPTERFLISIGLTQFLVPRS